MYHVLLPVDIDEARARAQVEAVLDLPGASESVRVDVLHVFEEIDVPADDDGRAFIDELNRNLENLRELPQTVDSVVDELEDAGVETSVHSVTADPASAILEVAEDFDVDAIVIGARRRSPVGKVLFGSVTQAVILESDRPVTVAPA
ncbi:universal stress protein [Natrialbaceae archaeon GCM10025810]|uniref:universal stress protein n=1 Tax=Halovalidus salilacus TaxID=3075124 RepID=UPI0036142C81